MKLRIAFPLRQVLPPPVYFVLAALLLLALEAVWAVFTHGFGPCRAADTALLARDACVVALMLAYGTYRVMAFHPLLNTDYRDWLKRSPWTHGLPLPIGPVYPVPADVVIVGALAALLTDSRALFDPTLNRPSAIDAFLTYVLAHATTLALIVWLTGPRLSAYGALFLLGTAVQLNGWLPVADVIALAAGWLVALAGLSHSWQLFPWDDTVEWGSRIRSRWKSAQSQKNALIADDVSPEQLPPSELGWPFGQLSPWQPQVTLGQGERMLMAALAGWWLHALLIHLSNPDLISSVAPMALGYGTLFLIIARVGTTFGNYASPLSFMGRLLTLRWIIPGYDQIIVAPLAIAAVPITVGLAGHLWLEVPPHVLIPIVIVLTLWTFLLVGPSTTRWKLTAPVQIVHGRLNKRNYDQLT